MYKVSIKYININNNKYYKQLKSTRQRHPECQEYANTLVREKSQRIILFVRNNNLINLTNY
jgi:hypothetical protein